MAAQRVPFEAKSIQELYKKIDRGLVSRIPSRYSSDLYQFIKLCLITDQKKRPTVAQLLRHPIIQAKIIEKNIEVAKTQGNMAQLMNTIKLPKNMDLLINRLPKKKYDSVKKRANSFDASKKKQYASSKPKESLLNKYD